MALRPLSQLQEWADNYNHNDVTAIARSIRRFGFNTSPRVWQDNTIIAGNHAFKALKLIQEQGADPELDRDWPPRNVEIQEGEWAVACVDVSYLDETEAKAFAIADNELARKAVTDDELLAQYLQEISARSEAMLVATGVDRERLARLLEDESLFTTVEEEDFEPVYPEQSDGSLLALTQVTIDAPRHEVERGDVWILGQHVLICADVLTEWPQWVKHLKGESIFAPYPGPFVPLTTKAETARMVMVQPDPYIAGHILDRYTDIKGGSSVRKTHGRRHV